MKEPPRWTLGFVIALSTITAIVLAVSIFFIHGPSTRPDELSYLLNGRVLTGHNETPLPGVRAFYQAGYSMVTAVGALFGASIEVQFRISLFLNMFFVLLTGLALYALMTRHFAISARWAALVAASISVAPSVAAYSLFAYAESLSRLLIAVVVLLVFEISSSATVSKMIATGAVAAFLPVLHGRFVLLLPLTVLAMIGVALFTQPRRYQPLVAGLSTCVVVYLTCDQLNMYLRNELYVASVGKEDRIVERMTTLSEWPSILRSAAGQMWYLVSTSFGLAFVGLAVLTLAVWRHLPKRSWREALPAMYVIATVGAVALTSSVQLAYVTRADHLIYGRYVEAVSPVLVAIACAALLASFRWRLWVLSLAVVAALTGILLIATDGDRLREMIAANRYFSAPNAIALDWTRERFAPIGYVVLAVIFISIAIVIMMLWWRSATNALVFLGCIGALATIYTATQTVIPYNEIRGDLILDNRIKALTDEDKRSDTQVAVDFNTSAANAFVHYRYLVHPIQLVLINQRNVVQPNVNCVISINSKPPATTGWMQGGDEPELDLTLWMREGRDSC
jgi:hypothetical protein